MRWNVSLNRHNELCIVMWLCFNRGNVHFLKSIAKCDLTCVKNGLDIASLFDLRLYCVPSVTLRISRRAILGRLAQSLKKPYELLEVFGIVSFNVVFSFHSFILLGIELLQHGQRT